MRKVKLAALVFLVALSVSAQDYLKTKRNAKEYNLTFIEDVFPGDERAVEKYEKYKREFRGLSSTVTIERIGYVIIKNIGYKSEGLFNNDESDRKKYGGVKAGQVEYTDNKTGRYYKVRLNIFGHPVYIISK